MTSVYLGNQRLLATQEMSATHGTVLELVRRVEGLGHKLYTGSYFSSPALFDNLFRRKINCCGTVFSDRRGMPKDVSFRAIKAKKGDIITRVRGNQSIVCWKDKRDVYVLTTMPTPPVEGNFCDKSGHAVKPHVTEDYNIHMGYVDKLDRMVYSYRIARRTWKWTKKLFFHLTDMTILNAFLLHKTCGGKMTHKRFRDVFIHNLITESHEQNVNASGVCQGSRSPSVSQISRLEVKHSQHWPPIGKQHHCRVCTMKNERGSTLYFCAKCDVSLCIVDCFERWHMRVIV